MTKLNAIAERRKARRSATTDAPAESLEAMRIAAKQKQDAHDHGVPLHTLQAGRTFECLDGRWSATIERVSPHSATVTLQRGQGPSSDRTFTMAAGSVVRPL